MPRARPLAALTVALSLLAATAPAHAAPTPSAALQIAFTMPSGPTSVYSTAPGNCLILSHGWSPESDTHYSGTTNRPRGLLDVTGRSGEAIVPGEAIHVDRAFVPHPYALAAMDVGLQLAGRRAYLTGTIRPHRAYSIRTAPRQRLAQLRGVAVASRTVRGALVVTVTGRATMLAPLAGMFNRLRCRGPHVDEHPIRVGAPLGLVKATVVPVRASAAVASVGFGVSLASGAYGPALPHVEPTGGATGDADGLTFAAAPGATVTATCTSSGCEPRDGHVALAGGFDLADGARRLSVTDLTLELAGGHRTLSATVGGARVQLTREQGADALLALTPDVERQLQATFGDPALTGYLRAFQLEPSALAPV